MGLGSLHHFAFRLVKGRAQQGRPGRNAGSVDATDE